MPKEVCLGPSTRAIVNAAAARGIPYRRLNTGSLVQFGYGRGSGGSGRRDRPHQRHRRGDRPGQGADPQLAPGGRRARAPRAGPVKDAEDAWAAADDIGVPVVVKPQDGNQGRGVATNLTTREQVMAAYEAARKESNVGPGRAVRPGQRLPAAGRGRQAGGGRPPRAGPGRRRRRPHRGRIGRDGQHAIPAAARTTPRR